MRKLDPGQIQDRLAEFPDWSLNGEQLQRTFGFDDFHAAMGFVNRVAVLAEERGHYPDIMIRSGKVTLTLATHVAGGLTEQDFDFARRTDELLCRRPDARRPRPVAMV
jgi:4a-hydroxytetrahydrobiopterin dehydratase